MRISGLSVTSPDRIPPDTACPPALSTRTLNRQRQRPHRYYSSHLTDQTPPLPRCGSIPRRSWAVVTPNILAARSSYALTTLSPTSGKYRAIVSLVSLCFPQPHLTDELNGSALTWISRSLPLFAMLWKTSYYMTNWRLVYVCEFGIRRIRGIRTEGSKTYEGVSLRGGRWSRGSASEYA
jgi:hypothetical protein